LSPPSLTYEFSGDGHEFSVFCLQLRPLAIKLLLT
jgi:hypothetical protein